MKYKLLVLDIDGTLTDSGRNITPATRKALLALQRSGTRIVLASGRPTYGVSPAARELELGRFGGYILSFNGGKIVECATGRALYEKTMPVEQARLLSGLARKNGVPILTYEEDCLITEAPENEYVLKESAINRMKIRAVASFAEAVRFPVTKCLMVGEGTHLAKVETNVKEAVGNELSVCRSEPFFLEIMPSHIDKAVSLGILSERLGISREEIAACGDGFNDRTMIRYAGLGVAMGNAQEPVKQAANYIAPTNDEDGVAHTVYKFMLQA